MILVISQVRWKDEGRGSGFCSETSTISLLIGWVCLYRSPFKQRELNILFRYFSLMFRIYWIFKKNSRVNRLRPRYVNQTRFDGGSQNKITISNENSKLLNHPPQFNFEFEFYEILFIVFKPSDVALIRMIKRSKVL